MMREELLAKALTARRAVMALCHAVEKEAAPQGMTAAFAADAIALRDQLIAELMQALGDICHTNGDSPDLEELIAKGRHVLDNVRDALPKAGE
jgi:hypothetical protein